MSQLFTAGGQSIGVSASASIFPMNIQGWFSLGLTGLISLLSKGHSSLPQHSNLKALILWLSAFFTVNPHIHSNHSFDYTNCLSLLFSAICKASSDNRFAFLYFFFLGMVLIPAICTMSWTSIHSSSGTLSIRSNPLNLFVASTV